MISAPPAQRWLELDACKALAIVGVVCIHSLDDWDPATMSLALLLWRLAGFSVLLFFFVSGWLFKAWTPVPLPLRLERAGQLLKVWLIWGVLYLLAGLLALRVGAIERIPNLFTFSYPFFIFSYQIYFLLLLAGFSAAYALLLWMEHRNVLSPPLALSLDLVVLAALLLGQIPAGWPAFPHGHQVDRVPTYAAAFLYGVVVSRTRSEAACELSPVWRRLVPLLPGALILLAALRWPTMLGQVSPWFFLLLPPSLPLLRGLMRAPTPLRRLLPLLAGFSGWIFLAHHPLLLPLIRRFFRLLHFPDLLNYLSALFLALLLPILLGILLAPVLLRHPALARLMLIQPAFLVTVLPARGRLQRAAAPR
jgi:hypothetical protein